MRGPERQRHPKNAPGPFYVEDGLCITCGVPENEAPDLITGTQEGHCYFYRQPETADELDQALEAVALCCSGAMDYDLIEVAALDRKLRGT